MPSSRPRSLTATLLTAVLAAACATGQQPQADSARRGDATSAITVYSGQHEQTVQALANDFTRRTGVRVELRSGNEAELANQILQEEIGRAHV